MNVPVPSAVARLANELARDLPNARERVRGEHTLVVKRLVDGASDRPGDGSFPALQAKTRETLRGQPAFEIRVTGVASFDEAVTGPSPVVYLAVDSPALRRLHDRLCEAFPPVADLESDAYVPHVTIARGGSQDAAARLTEREIDPITWTVTELHFRDADRRERAGTISLPA